MSQQYDDNLYCSPCSNNNVCLSPSNETVSVVHWEVDTSQCKHPSIVDSLINNYHYRHSYLRDACDLGTNLSSCLQLI